VDYSKLELEKNLINERHTLLIRNLEISLDKYMKNLPDSPLIMPIKTKIFIEKKNIIIDHLNFNAADNTDKLFEIVKNYFTTLGDEIDFSYSYFCIERNSFDSSGNLVSIVQIIASGQKFLRPQEKLFC
jgi:hypothetical protein